MNIMRLPILIIGIFSLTITLNINSIKPVKAALLLKEIPISGAETLKTDDVETFTQETFHDLIKSQFDKSLPFILAMTTTLSSGKPVTHFFDASQLNRYLFNSSFFPSLNLSPLASKNNPLTRQPFQQIQYYILYPFKKNFELLGTYNDLATNNKNRFFIHAHFNTYNQNPDMSNYITLGESYRSGTNQFTNTSIPADNEKAVYFFDLVTKSLLPYWRGYAQLELAKIYQYGLGTMPADLAKAKNYYEQAAASLTEFESQNPDRVSARSSTMRKEANAKAQELSK